MEIPNIYLYVEPRYLVIITDLIIRAYPYLKFKEGSHKFTEGKLGEYDHYDIYLNLKQKRFYEYPMTCIFIEIFNQNNKIFFRDFTEISFNQYKNENTWSLDLVNNRKESLKALFHHFKLHSKLF